MANFFKVILFFVLPIVFLIPSKTEAASLSITPSSATFEVGDLITLQVIVSSNSSINAISSSILFPKSILSIESVSKSNSMLNFWVAEPSFSNTLGTINFEGVSLGGFQGNTGTVATIRLRAIKSGTGKVSFQSGKVLANDGNGTDLLATLIGSNITIQESKIKPEKVETKIEPEIETDIPQSRPSLGAPEISLTSKYGEPAISGISDYPKVKALVIFVSQDGFKVYIDGVTDVNGEFILPIPRSLKNGIYTVSSVIVLDDGRNTIYSKEITVRVGSFFSDMSWKTFSLLALFLLIIIYQFWMNHNGKGKEKAIDITRKSFNILREDIRNKKVSGLKKDIDIAEDVIKKEIKNIKSS